MYTALKRIAVILLGSYAVTAQVVFVREFLVVFLGNELCVGVIFASWFLGVALGAAASSRPSRTAASGEGPFIALLAALALLSPAALMGVRSLRYLLNVPPGEYVPFVSLILSTLLLIVPFSFVIGFAFPFACLLPLGGARGERGNVGRAYVLESVGSIAGGVAFSFILVGRFPALEILIGWAAAIFLVLCALSMEEGPQRRATPLLGALCAACLIVLATGLAGKIDAAGVRARWKSLNPELPLVVSVDSRYENLALGRNEGQYDCFGNGQYYFSFPDPYAYASTAHMIMAEHPRPKSVLLIGGGAGGMIREIRRYPLSLLRYVELDPALIGLVYGYLDPAGRRALDEAPVRIFYGDGRRFVKTTQERFDVVIVSVPDPSTAMLNRFYTREFFEETRRILKPGGVFSTRLSAPADYYGGDVGSYAGSVYLTLRAVFRYVAVAPGEENYFFASSDAGVLSTEVAELERRWKEKGMAVPHFSPRQFLSWWLPERVAFTRDALEKQGRGRINTDARPVTYYFNLVLWSRYSGSRIAGALRLLGGFGLPVYLLPILALFALRLFWLIARGKRGERQSAFHALLAIGATGFTAMALEIMLLFAFQNIYGYVYQMLGVIVALFMAGLACGGWGANTLLVTEERRWALWLAWIEIAVAAYATTIPAIIRRVGAGGAHSELIFLALVFAAGFAAGAEFPLASSICMRRAASVGRTAARVNAFDHFGACAGSLLTGVIFVPLLGLHSSCILLAVMNAAAGALLLAGRGEAE